MGYQSSKAEGHFDRDQMEKQVSSPEFTVI